MVSKAAWITIFWATLLSACVTVNLGGSGTGKKAQGVQFHDPAAPFRRDNRDDVDAAWKNPNNGNVISFLSDCKDPTDPPLDQIVRGVLGGLSDLHYESTEMPTFQGREARRVLASGKVDGVPSQIDLLAVKRNTCIYLLSYVGVRKSFLENRDEFERFVQGFKAP